MNIISIMNVIDLYKYYGTMLLMLKGRYNFDQVLKF